MTDELLMDPDVETAVISYLNTWLTLISGESAVAADTVQEGRCVHVIQTGGPARVDRVVCHPQLTIDSYDDNPFDASELSRRVGALVCNLEGTEYEGVTFGKVETLAAAANLPNPTTARERYTQTFILTAHAEPLDI